MIGQKNGQLFIQQQLETTLTNSDIVTYLGIIIFLSRISRIISNILFTKVYSILKDKVSIFFAGLLFLSFLFMLIGYFLHLSLLIRIIIISLGFIIILALRDPFRAYIYDIVLKNCSKNYQQTILIYLALARKIGIAIIGIIASLILIKCPLIYVIIMLFILSFIGFYFSIKLYKIINSNNN